MNGTHKSLSPSMLTWLRAFEAVARLGNVTRAAEELHITQSATSQQIRRLEDALGFRLIRRDTRPLGLTGEGARLAEVVETSFSEIRRTLADIGTPGGAVPITLSCSPSFAMQWLTPRLSDLRQDRPRVDIRVFGEFHRLDKARMSSEQLQAAIRYDPGDYPNLVSRLFLDEYLIPVASPGFMAAHPELASAGSLQGKWLLHDSRPWTDADELGEWRCWLDAVGGHCTDLQAGKRFNLAMLAVGAAVAGEGIAIGRTAMVLDELRRGSLVAPFPYAVRSPAAYHFITMPDHSVQVQMIGDWIRSQGEQFITMRTTLFTELGIRLPGASLATAG